MGSLSGRSVAPHENLTDARQHDLAMRDRIEHDLQLLS